MRKIALGLIAAAALISIASGLRFLLADEYLTYHAVITGKSWSLLDVGLQTLILAMMKAMGAGYIASGIATLWLLLPIGRDASWGRWAVLTVMLANWVPVLYVATWARTVVPSAQTPVAGTAGILALTLVGVALLFFAKPKALPQVA